MTDNIKSTPINDKKSKIRERYKGVDAELLDVIPAIPEDNFYDEAKIKRVAVYARVSTDDPRQTTSYELQKNYYHDLISRRPDWKLIDIYADEGISGTSLQHRDEFKRMISDCEAGKIDLIVTKSISRFARNLMDCVGYIRKLKAQKPPIGIFFETEHCYTLDSNSEMTISFLATLAQEESHTKSEIMNASIEMRFKRGIFLTPPLLGYDQDEDGNLVINEEEALTVRLIFFMYLFGYSTQEIATKLTDLKRRTKKGNLRWNANSVLQILQNERHCGDVLARKTYTPNYLDHKSKKNKQNRNQYRQRDHHEPIISRDDFIAVQRMIDNAKYGNRSLLPQLHVIHSGMLKGFVPVNPRWAGFKPKDYHEACLSTYDTESMPVAKREVVANSGDFDLRGYEIARGQFFDSCNRTIVTISIDNIQFNTQAVRTFDNIPEIEILVHAEELLLAVRPAPKESKNVLRWARKSNGRYSPVHISGKAFLPTLFELFGWNTKCRYRLIGTTHTNRNESVILFDLNDTEIQIPKNIIPPISEQSEDNLIPLTCGTGKRVLAFPADWVDSFGNDYYLYVYFQQMLSKESEWNTAEQGKPYKPSDLHTTDINTIGNEIETIINEMKEMS